MLRELLLSTPVPRPIHCPGKPRHNSMPRELSANLRLLRKHDARLIVLILLALALVLSASSGTEAQSAILTASDPATDDEAEELLDEDEPEAEPEEPVLKLCETDLRLSGTFFNAQAPQRSFATFHVHADHPGGEVYRVGERVGAFGILSVEERTVVLDDGGAGCYLKLAGASAPPATPAKKPSKKKKKSSKAESKRSKGGDFTAEELNASIRALGGDRYEIKKELLPKIAQRSAALRGSTKWSQVRGYSSVLGLRLEKLASGGLLEHLGLRTGDMVKTLNGLQLSSLEGALEAQKLVSSSSNLSLLIQRDGTPVTLEYRVVP